MENTFDLNNHDGMLLLFHDYIEERVQLYLQNRAGWHCGSYRIL